MRSLDRLIDHTRSISRYAVWTAGACMIGTVLLVGAEVVCRKLGLLWISGSSEVGGYMLAVCSAWAFSFTLLSRSNIRFDGLYLRCGPAMRAYLDLCGLLGLGVFMLAVAYYAWKVLATSFALGSHSTSSLAVPLWLPQAAWVAGLLFLCWTILILSLRVVVALARRDYATVARLAGVEAASEEVEREAREAERKLRPTEALAVEMPLPAEADG
jgi:TRAP-type mannitol/chloroaromatic compound transport system permease small subunit